jgi:hypothetical protein
MKLLKFVPYGHHGSYRVVYSPNRKVLGVLYKEVDGFYTFTARSGGSRGSWGGEVLRELGCGIIELNKTWKEEVERYGKGKG